MANQPTLLMTFAANNLAGVKVEADKILKSAKKNKSLKVKRVNDVTIDTLADAILSCGKDLTLFHFGGHADPKGIVLNGLLELDKTRLSRLLLSRKDHQLQFIFLNGCLSYGHVGVLTAGGVKVIIATNVRIDDTEAVRMAKYFYQTFFEENYTLKAAFEFAEATVRGKNSFPIIVNPGEIDENQAMPSSWTLFVHTEFTKVLDWKLSDFLNVVAPIPPLVNPTQKPTQQPPKPMSFKETVEDLVANENLKEALDAIATKSNDSQITLLKSRVNRLLRNENGGTMDLRDTEIERNKIKVAILALLNDVG